jgi:cell division protease FtsH
MAEALVKYETIDKSQIDDIMAGKEPKPPEGWEALAEELADEKSAQDLADQA